MARPRTTRRQPTDTPGAGGGGRVGVGKTCGETPFPDTPVSLVLQHFSRFTEGRRPVCLELARNFSQITNERHQEALSQLARTLAQD